MWRASWAGRSVTLTHFSSHCNTAPHDSCYYILLLLKKIVVKLKCFRKEQELCISGAIAWLIVHIYHNNSFPIIFPLLLQWREKQAELWLIQSTTEHPCLGKVPCTGSTLPQGPFFCAKLLPPVLPGREQHTASFATPAAKHCWANLRHNLHKYLKEIQQL